MSKIDVLDKGYVRLRNVMGDDRTIVNAARVSFDKRSEKLTGKDKKLIDFLAREGHTSPFRHATLQFEVYAPLMIARQWWKYAVGSDHVMDAWNESSRRYITENNEFYVPEADEWRSYPDNVKQGSGEPIPEGKGEFFTSELIDFIDRGVTLYNYAIEHGIAPEQARLFLPAYGMYVRWYWTASLQSVAHLIEQRTATDAQYEFRLYAEAVKKLAEDKFPVSLNALLKTKKGKLYNSELPTKAEVSE